MLSFYRESYQLKETLMKFVVVAALGLLSLSSFASVISSSTQITSVGDTCYDASSGRSANYGIGKACFEYSKIVTQRHSAITDPESRGRPVPGARPYTTESSQTVKQCNYGSNYGGNLMEACEVARAAMAKKVR